MILDLLEDIPATAHGRAEYALELLIGVDQWRNKEELALVVSQVADASPAALINVTAPHMDAEALNSYLSSISRNDPWFNRVCAASSAPADVRSALCLSSPLVAALVFAVRDLVHNPNWENRLAFQEAASGVRALSEGQNNALTACLIHAGLTDDAALLDPNWRELTEQRFAPAREGQCTVRVSVWLNSRAAEVSLFLLPPSNTPADATRRVAGMFTSGLRSEMLLDIPGLLPPLEQFAVAVKEYQDAGGGVVLGSHPDLWLAKRRHWIALQLLILGNFEVSGAAAGMRRAGINSFSPYNFNKRESVAIGSDIESVLDVIPSASVVAVGSLARACAVSSTLGHWFHRLTGEALQFAWTGDADPTQFARALECNAAVRDRDLRLDTRTLLDMMRSKPESNVYDIVDVLDFMDWD